MIETSTGQDGSMAPVIVRVYKEIPNHEKHLRNWSFSCPILTRSISVFWCFFDLFLLPYLLVELSSHLFFLYNSWSTLSSLSSLSSWSPRDKLELIFFSALIPSHQLIFFTEPALVNLANYLKRRFKTLEEKLYDFFSKSDEIRAPLADTLLLFCIARNIFAILQATAWSTNSFNYRHLES